MGAPEVEYRAVLTLTAQDMEKAALQGAAVIQRSPHLFLIKTVSEENFQPDSRQADYERVAQTLCGKSLFELG